MLTSIDQEGTEKGYDVELVKRVAAVVNIPLIVSGGAASVQDMISLYSAIKVEAISAASILHYGKTDIHAIKTAWVQAQIPVRQI